MIAAMKLLSTMISIITYEYQTVKEIDVCCIAHVVYLGTKEYLQLGYEKCKRICDFLSAI